ncbi:MAG: lipoprotein-releasing system permease protein [Bacteroidetes bacterium]|nr:MAG: lipoprotein-releasing system permease protein [Bacteroidota bacterium]
MQKANLEIAITHIVTRKKQTLVAALGVTIGLSIYLFMNSLTNGFDKFQNAETFKSTAHIKIYKDDEQTKPLSKYENSRALIINSQIVNNSKKIINPLQLISIIKKEPYITDVIMQVDFSAFYNKGTAQVKGTGNGVNIAEYNSMFNTQKYMKAGSISDLQNNMNGIILGSGIAEKLGVRVGDNISVSSSFGVGKNLKIVGIFELGSSMVDNAKSFVNISTAQQFLKESSSYVNTIYANTVDYNNSTEYMNRLQQLTNYTVEDWKTTNADIMAISSTRNIMFGAISFAILVVAAFGIYNILSSTITQKINDIAILKATGYRGSDVIQIFITEALIMGLIGAAAGLLLGSLLIFIMQNVYVGGPVGYFPISFEKSLMMESFLIGIFVTLFAGYFPAKKAADVDPVSIFRK